MKYVATDSQFISRGLLHAELKIKQKKGELPKGDLLYPDGTKVKLNGVIEASDDFIFETKLKDKVKDTEAEAEADKVEKIKSKDKKAK